MATGGMHCGIDKSLCILLLLVGCTVATGGMHCGIDKSLCILLLLVGCTVALISLSAYCSYWWDALWH